MWKRNEANESSKRPMEVSGPDPLGPPAAAAARIGGSLSIKGDLYGEEDLFIEGKIEGNIKVKTGSVTIGEQGRVKADIEATNIHVAGEVHGDLAGSEGVVLLETGRVQGNITAKNVTLQSGAQFKGSIDMESAQRSAGSRGRTVVPEKSGGASERLPSRQRA